VRSAAGMLDLGASLPDRLERLTDRAGQGGGELARRREDLDELVAAWRAGSGRVAAAGVAAGVLVGLPLGAIPRPPPGWRSLALLWFLGGVVAVVVLLGRLLIGALNRRR